MKTATEKRNERIWATICDIPEGSVASYGQIAEIAGIPEKTVKSRLFTGRELLRQTLVQKGYSR